MTNRSRSSLNKTPYFGNNAHSFVLEKESARTVYEYRRTRLSYKLGYSSREAHLGLCELDGLSVLSLSSNNTHLFSTIISEGLESRLIRYLASCEMASKPYLNPTINDPCGLSVTELFKQKPYYYQEEEQAKKEEWKTRYSDSDSEKGSQEVHQYSMNGGMPVYYYIKEYDPDFFKMLYKAVEKGLCKILRLDLCCDHSENLMSLLSQSVKRGRAHGYGSHLHGIGELDTVTFSGRVGPRTSLYKTSIKESKSFNLETLYVGHERHSECVVCFYDKQKEQMERRERHHQDNTRIEIRFFRNRKRSKYEKVMNLLLYSLAFPREEGTGQYMRYIIFTCALFTHICVERGKRCASENSMRCEMTGNWSDWFRDLYKVFVAGCVHKWSCAWRIKEKDFFKLLIDFKKEPNSIQQFLPLSSNNALLNQKQLSEASIPESKNLSTSSSVIPAESVEVIEEKGEAKVKRGRPKGSLDSYKRSAKNSKTRLGRPKKDSKTRLGRPRKDTKTRLGRPRKAITVDA